MTRPCSSSHDEVRSMNSTPTNRGSRKTSSAQAWHRIGTASATRRSESSALRPIAQVKSCRAGAPDAGFGICGMTQSAMCRCWQKRSRRTRLRRITIESGSWYRLCGGEILSRGRWVTPKDVPSGRPDAGRDVPTRCDDRHLDKSKRDRRPFSGFPKSARVARPTPFSHHNSCHNPLFRNDFRTRKSFSPTAFF